MRALVVLLLLGAAVPASADDARPEEDACQGDIHRLCDRFFPDARLVANCLIDRRTDLSPTCAELLANPPTDAEGAPPAAAAPSAGMPSR